LCPKVRNPLVKLEQMCYNNTVTTQLYSNISSSL
jgi:hypothetical protein